MDPIAANPLHDLHAQAQAEFQPYADTEIVATFGEPQAEYAAIHKSCGLMDEPFRGIVELTGGGRLEFLNRLLTNKTWEPDRKTGLSAGRGVYAYLLTTKGRIVADMNVVELGNRTWLQTDARLVETLAKELERYHFSEDVKIAHQRGKLHQIAFHGPKAPAVAAMVAIAAGGEQAGGDIAAQWAALDPLSSMPITVFGVSGTVIREDRAGVAGYGLVVPIESARKVWMGLISSPAAVADPAEPGRRLLRPVGWAAFNSARIEAGRALFGIDFDDSVLPGETGKLTAAVSFNKGCYIGQEIVTRMHTRGQVARQIAGFKMDDDALPIAGTPIVDAEQNTIGAVTSSTMSPSLSQAAIGLALLKRPWFEPGAKLKIPAEGKVRGATVVKLPFLEAKNG